MGDQVEMSAAHSVDVLVLHPRDVAAPTSGGIQTFLRDFVKHSPTDFRISIAGLTSDPRRRPVGRWQRLEIGERECRFLPLAREGASLAHPPGLPDVGLAALRFLRARRSNTILQVHRPYRAFLYAGHRGPRVQFVHVDIGHWPGPEGWQRLRGIYRHISDAGLARMDRVFVANRAGVRLLQAEHPELAQRISFLPGWFDEETFRRPSADERLAARSRIQATLGLSMPAGERLVLVVGRLEEVKQPMLALEAFARLVHGDGAPSSRLLFVGGGELRADVAAGIERLGLRGRVHLLDEQPRDEVARLLRAADALLLTSTSEGGGPRVVLEALGSGVPVVATVVGEVERVVLPGQNGWLAGDRRPQSLADGLRWVLDQPHDEIAAAAVRAAQPFTAARVLPELYESYRSLVRSA